MEKIEVQSKLSWDDYKRFMYFALYTKPIILLAVLASFVYFVTVLVKVMLGSFSWEGIPFYFFISSIFFLFILPVVYVIVVRKSHRSKNQFTELITYHFDQDFVEITTPTMNSKFPWSQIEKINETNLWFLLFFSKSNVFVLLKREMTKEQLSDLRALLASIPDLRYKQYAK